MTKISLAQWYKEVSRLVPPKTSVDVEAEENVVIPIEGAPINDLTCDFEKCINDALFYTGTKQQHENDEWNYRCEKHKLII